MKDQWGTYLLWCNDGTLYCGVTNDIGRRIDQHNAGKGARYTRGRTPVELALWMPAENKVAAFKEEYRVKKLGRLQKLQMIGERLMKKHGET